MPKNDPQSDTTTQRPIRSFVKRQGRMTPGQKRALTELWPELGIDLTETTLDLDSAFGRTAPVVLEIGIGNGENLVAMAAQTPQHNFLGIEVHEPGIGHCLLKIEEQKLTNVRLMRDDAVVVLKTMLADKSLGRVNLFFPDPWHKKRHHKRRIVQPAFVELVGQKLDDGGIFHIVTDWVTYAEHIEEVLTESTLFSEMDAAPQDRITTRFDNRGQRLGHTNYERAWCKVSNNRD